MGVRLRFVTALIAAAVLCFSAVAAQQLDPGDVEVAVTDSQTHAPIANAAVFLLGGEQPISSLTNERGRLEFAQVSPGTYRMSIRLAGYDQYDVSAFEVLPHTRVTINVAMQLSLKTIARLTAHASSSISQQDLNAGSAERKISTTLSDALNKLAGVSIDDQLYGSDAGFNVSLNNHDASQTALSIDGIRLAGPASGMLNAAQNLFTGASVSFTPAAGHLGGSVNFQTLQPTKLWTYDFKNTFGNYGAQTDSLAATGTTGRLGIALQHVFTRRDSFLSGLTYEDQSGSTYLHLGGDDSTADLAKLTLTIDKRTSARLSGILTQSTSDELCANYTTVLPCGYGPGAKITFGSRFGTFALSSLIGNVDTSLSLFGFNSRNGYDYPRRYLNGVLRPYFSHSSNNGAGGYVNASITAKRHTDSVSAQFSQHGGDVTRPVNGSDLTVAQPREQYRVAGFSDSVKANPKLTLTHGVSIESGTSAGSALVLSEAAEWTASKNDRFQGSVSAGSAEPAYGLRYPITDVLAADYDCHNGSVYVNGPADPGVRQSSISYNLSWRHTYHGGNFTLNAYRQNAYGQQFFAAVPILAEPDDAFANGRAAFLQQLQNVWNSPAVCAGYPFNPQHIYVPQFVAGLGQVYQGMTLSGRVNLGRNVAAFPAFALGSTYLSSLDPRLEAAGSYYAIGRQLPHRPLRTAGLTVDGVLPRSHMEWLANAQFTSINNQYDLPAYTMYSAGLVFDTHYGSLTLIEANVFGTRAGLFSTYQGVNPVPLAGGGTFAFASDPLPPRQWLLTWDIPWHEHKR